MRSHDEPNEWGFAGQGTAPEPAHDTPEEARRDAAEDIAVPGADLATELSQALVDATDGDENDLPDNDLPDNDLPDEADLPRER